MTNARPLVLIVGIGGIGCPASMALARTGSVDLRLVDDDRVDISNLHRQLLFETADAGRPKVEAAAQHLAALNPELRIETARARFDGTTADSLLAGIDVVLDGSDNFPSRFFVNDACVEAGVPLVHAAVLGLAGQLMTVLPGKSACYRCIFEAPPPPGTVPTCARAGVLGPIAGVIGALAAAECLRLTANQTPAHADKLLSYEPTREGIRAIGLAINPRCSSCSAHHRSDSPTPAHSR